MLKYDGNILTDSYYKTFIGTFKKTNLNNAILFTMVCKKYNNLF